MLLLRGILAILFGVFTYLAPGITLATLVLFFGAYALVDGVFDIIQAIRGREEHEHWWVLLLEGLAGILFGALTFWAPGMTAIVLMFYIAAWAMITGAMRLVLAIRLRKEIEGEFWLGLSGVLSIVFGFLVMAQPGVGALALAWVIGLWATALGITLVALAFRVRGWKKKVEGRMEARAHGASA